jgi:hypothetical protein
MTEPGKAWKTQTPGFPIFPHSLEIQNQDFHIRTLTTAILPTIKFENRMPGRVAVTLSDI